MSAVQRQSCADFIAVILYGLQMVMSIHFFHWLLHGAWNDRSPFTSGLFFTAEVVAFVSSTLCLSSSVFVIFQRKQDKDTDFTTKYFTTNTCNEFLPNNNEKEDIIFEEGCSTVAVCVFRYQEPIQDLIKTVESIDLISWPGNKL